MKKNWLVLLILLLGGLVLRWINLGEAMTFLYDHGRDALAANNILRGDFVLVGQTTDFPGLFFGPLWYYFLAVLYLICDGSPLEVLKIISLFDLASIALIFLVAEEIFERKVAIVSAFLWAFGALPVAYSRTLSNPSTTAFWALLVFYLFLGVFKRRHYFLTLALFFQAIMFQFNAAAAYIFLPFSIVTTLLLLRKGIKRKYLFLGLILGFFTVLPQIIFELRNGFIQTQAILHLFSKSASGVNFFQLVSVHFENLKIELSDYTFYGYKDLSLVIFLVGLFLSFCLLNYRRKIFLLWVFLPLVNFLFLYFRAESHPFYLLSWVPVAVILLANTLVSLIKQFPVIFYAVLLSWIMANFTGLEKEIVIKEHIAQPADPILAGLGDQLRVVDYIYAKANGEMFGYYAYTVTPYWADEHWQYLFNWYGKKKYGYIPIRQSGSPLFIIIEPEPFLGQNFQDDWLKKIHVPANGKVVSSQNIGSYLVEKISK